MTGLPARKPDPARSPAVERFVNGTMLSMDQWRDGEGYDRTALLGLSNPEAAFVLDLLNQRLENSGAGWRDVDALATLEIPPARMALARLVTHWSAEVRLRAARHLSERGNDSAAEVEIVRLLRDPGTDIGAAALMAMAEHHPTAACGRRCWNARSTGRAISRFTPLRWRCFWPVGRRSLSTGNTARSSWSSERTTGRCAWRRWKS